MKTTWLHPYRIHTFHTPIDRSIRLVFGAITSRRIFSTPTFESSTHSQEKKGRKEERGQALLLSSDRSSYPNIKGEISNKASVQMIKRSTSFDLFILASTQNSTSMNLCGE